MTHKTKALVLKTVKFGETSLVVTLFTELFGLQAYLVNGVRSNKPGKNKMAMYQPASLLELEVYRQPQKNLQRIKEANRSYLSKEIHSDVIKNSLALFMVELLYNCLKEPEENKDLFYFCEDAFISLDEASKPVAANFSLFFCLQIIYFLGFSLGTPSPALLNSPNLFFDLQDGQFTNEEPTHADYLKNDYARVTAELLNVRQPEELKYIQLNQTMRRELLKRYLDFYSFHIPNFGRMRTLEILQQIWNGGEAT